MYASTTANSNLCTHLEAFHEDEYVEVCLVNGWPMQLQKRKKREEEIRLTQSTLDGVVKPGTTLIFTYLHRRLLTWCALGVEGRVTFSRPALVRYLVNFIVADDQVRSMTALVEVVNDVI
jgi:hypothetical protein